MNAMGIMQGRLSAPVDGRIQSFPRATWSREFALARRCGLDVIDWVFDAERWQENPLMTGPGLDQALGLIERTGVRVDVVCADFCMEAPLIRCSQLDIDERMLVLRRLLARSYMAGVRVVELPFVDNSAIRDEAELQEVADLVRWLADEAAALDIVLALETSLGPIGLRELLKRARHPAVKANYDIGNSASNGYDVRDEMIAYGEDVATVHVKDRVRGGGSVPLGRGNADFRAAFAALAEFGYAGPFILQVARGTDEFEWCRQNMAFVREHLGFVGKRRISA